MSKPYILAVANRKGGTGKTTTAVNLAAQWARRGERTLLIDLDSQGHAGYGLGVTTGTTCHEIFQQEEFDLAQAIQSTPMDQLYVMPAEQSFLANRANTGELTLRSALQRASVIQQFDRVVLDTPPTLDFLLLNALASADGVVVPFVPHPLAEIGVKQLARLFYRVACRSNPTLRLVGLLPVMVDRRLQQHRKTIEQLRSQFGSERVLRSIRSNIRLAEAFAARRPIHDYAPTSAGAMDYLLLAEELDI